MGKENNERCWSCPNRTGLSRLTGKLACKFYRFTPQDREKVIKQRGDCPGPSPIYDGSTGTRGVISESETEVFVTRTRDEYYRIDCPSDTTPTNETPEAVVHAMAANDLTHYVHRTVEVDYLDADIFFRRRQELQEMFDGLQQAQ